MKRLFLIFLLMGLGFNLVSAQNGDCDPASVKEWMVQRQIGRNQLQPILDGTTTNMTPIDGLLLVQKVRRDLEDLPRPACADSLYNLTIYFYDTVGDMLTFGLKNDASSMNTISQPRLQRYIAAVDPLYNPLQTTAGVDIMAEAAARGSVVPTAAPTEVLQPMDWNGTDATVIGPIRIPQGIYRATATTDKFISVILTVTDGECGSGSGSILGPGLFALSEGQATAGAEAVLTSHGCTALIAVSNVQSAWTLKFDKVG